METFLGELGSKPDQVASFGGALLYRQYNPFIRFLMRVIVRFAGGETATSRDYARNWASDRPPRPRARRARHRGPWQGAVAQRQRHRT